MEKIPIKILTVSWDPTLAMEKPTFGDAQQRNIEYGKYVSNIYTITYSPKNLNLPVKKLSENVIIYPTNSKNAINFIFDAWRIAKNICAHEKIDIVLTQDPFLTGLVGNKIKNKYGSKLLIHFHGDFWSNQYWLKEKWYNFILFWLSQRIVKKADALRVVSLGIKNKLIRSGIKVEKIAVIHTPTDINKFLVFDNQQLEGLKQKYSAGGYKNLLFIGRLEKEKNLDWFLEVFAQIKKEYKQVNFLIGGDGSLKDKIILKIKTLKLENSVKFVGQINFNDLTNYYRLADIFILPSTSESFGKVLVEAGASGIPCVATNTTGAQEIIQDGKTGFLVPIQNKEMMKEKILLLLNDENLTKKMGAQAQNYIQENYDNNKQIIKVITLWQSMIKK